jgi:hypothetical protein
MKLANAKEFIAAAPKGRYPVKITSAEATTSKAGASMIKVQAEIREGEYAGRVFWDYFITDGDVKGAGMAKKKLRGLGIDVEAEQDDADVCEQLLGREAFADLDVEEAKEKDGVTTKRDANGEPYYNNKAVGYATTSVGGTGASAQAAAKPNGATATGPQTTTPPTYKEGDVVNGHKLTNGAWVPVPAAPPPAPPKAAAPPAPPAPPAAFAAPPGYPAPGAPAAEAPAAKSKKK